MTSHRRFFAMQWLLALTAITSFVSPPHIPGVSCSRLAAVERRAAQGLRAAVVDDGAALMEVYTTTGCSYCRKAKALLKRLEVEFVEIDVSEDAEARDDMARRAGAATVPQIFVAGAHVGGATELIGEYEAGALADRFTAAGIAFVEAPPAEDLTATAAAAGQDQPVANVPAAPPAVGSATSVLNAPSVQGSSEAGAGQQQPADFEGGAAALSTALQRRMLRLMDEHLVDDGSLVDYAALRTSAAFTEFCDAVTQLQSLPPEALGADAPLNERKAFWINLYNCLVLHATAVYGAPTDGPQRSAFFSGTAGAAYCICGAQRFCLDDIEHGILRCNSPTVGSVAPLFGPDDARLPFVLPGTVDPRIHFALNCGAKSCPPIKFYGAEQLDAELALAARAFLEADLAPRPADGVLECTKLLDWYGGDFGSSPSRVVARLREVLPGDLPLAASLGALLDQTSEPTLDFRPYDWGSNEAS